MRTHAINAPHQGFQTAPDIASAPFDAPLHWLVQGVQTFLAAPRSSLLYGALFTLACWAMIGLTWALPWFAVAFLTGLMLLGPFLAAGLYVAARQRDVGEPVNIAASLSLLWERRTNLSLFVLFLALIAAAWVRLSALLFAIQYATFTPSSNSFSALLSGQFDPALTLFFVGIGLLLAIVVFVTSAVSIPMILDRDVGPLTAIQTSIHAVKQNWPAMTLWAMLIVALTGFGILTLFFGLIVLFPILGYATWRSYRELVA